MANRVSFNLSSDALVRSVKSNAKGAERARSAADAPFVVLIKKLPGYVWTVIETTQAHTAARSTDGNTFCAVVLNRQYHKCRK